MGGQRIFDISLSKYFAFQCSFKLLELEFLLIDNFVSYWKQLNHKNTEQYKNYWTFWTLHFTLNLRLFDHLRKYLHHKITRLQELLDKLSFNLEQFKLDKLWPPSLKIISLDLNSITELTDCIIIKNWPVFNLSWRIWNRTYLSIFDHNW